MKHLTWLGAIAVSFTLLFWTTDPLEAAKGVKKGAEHKIQGTITSINNGSLVVHSKAHNKKRKAGAAKTTQAGRTRDHTLKITAATRVENVMNGKHTPATVANLRSGEHIVVFAHNGNADKIEIHHHGKKRKT